MNLDLHVVIPGSLDQRTGGTLYDARMVEGLRRRGWRVTVHNLRGSFPLDRDGIAGRSLAQTLARLPDGAPAVLDGLAMGAHPELLAAHRERLRLVALIHHPLADETGLEEGARSRLRDAERRALTSVRGVVVTSAFTAARLRAYGVDPGRVRVVEPGTEAFPGGPEASPGHGGDGEPLLLTVGSVIPRKGHDTLVRALGRLAGLPWRWVAAGSLTREPAFADRVRGAVAAQELEDRVHLAGEMGPDELGGLYRRAALFVLPSHYEGYGMALTEALIHGIPVVSTTGGAIPHTVPEGAGILVPAGDPAALADALRALLTDRARWMACAAAARAHAVQLPVWSRQVERFEAAVRELASGPAGPVRT